MKWQRPRSLRSRHSNRFPIIRWSRLLAVAAFLTSLTFPCHGQPNSIDQREYAIKAAFLFHFTQFIVWPSETTAPPGEPIRIGVLAPNPFGGILEEIVRDETVNGRPIEVVHLTDLEAATSLHILFIPRNAPQAQREAISRLRNEPVLLVSEERGFTEAGGMVALVRDQERVAIVINRSALDQAGLSASSRLLRLAQTVGSPAER